MEPQTDEEYAMLVRDGDREAFGVLVDRYQAKLLRYGRKFMSAQEDIEDIVQNVFVSAYINIKSFDVSQKFSPWIYRIAHNAFVDGLRKNGRSPFVAMDFDTFFSHAVSDDSIENNYDRKEIKATINRGLDQLPPKYREVMILYYLEDLPYKDIADILRVPMGTVSARIRRAKAELKNILKK